MSTQADGFSQFQQCGSAVKFKQSIHIQTHARTHTDNRCIKRVNGVDNPGNNKQYISFSVEVSDLVDLATVFECKTVN